MNRQLIIRCFTVLTTILFLSGCVATRAEKPMPSFSPINLNAKSYSSKVDSFVVLFDASSSMLDYHNGNKKFTLAKAVVTRMNQTIPQLGQKAGFRSFGHDPSVSKNNTELFFGMNNYSTSGFAKGIDKVTVAGGVSPLYKALQAAEKDLETSSGKKAIIIISDGQKTDMVVPNTLDYAQKLKDKFGSSLCIYTIAVGGSPEGIKFMSDLSKIAECGFSSNADNLLASTSMADFVKKVFLSGKSKARPKRVKKVKPVKKVRKDSDHDGIFDDNDLCPNTPIGAKVNVKGCWSFGDALFDTNKADIKQNAYTLLNHAHTIFTKNPGMKVILKGHTDNYGTNQYNMDLSLKRANAVKAYLVNRGIDSSRLTCQAFGESSPIATNDTKEGRALNRRVELSPEK
ncbi:MAG: OmpA family protein [Desulfobacteraceae bacterium]|nr:OmpA family protein [Desulfobacteraceae bacterium]